MYSSVVVNEVKAALIVYAQQPCFRVVPSPSFQSVNPICHCGLVGNTLTYEHRSHEFKPKYRETYSGSENHLKLSLGPILIDS